ncbi:MAG: class I SAM-dependent methyltransferase [Nitritalea sp.]
MKHDIQLLHPENWDAYALIDCGGFEKLERFGDRIMRRPEPQAIWDKSLSEAEWSRLADASFRKEKHNPEKGQWEFKHKLAHNWQIPYQNPEGLQLKLNLATTSFKHIGLFPEQAVNWDYIYRQVKAMPVENPRVLNLFAYTGAASLAAKAAGAEVTHLDAVKQVVTWSRHNMESSGLQDIRWIVDDAMKFIKREQRRGNTYHGIILDPPAYGRGPDGEKWVLEEQVNELLKTAISLLEPEHHFFLLNMYSLSFSALIAANLVQQIKPDQREFSYGELFLQDEFKKKLPLGIFYRFHTQNA